MRIATAVFATLTALSGCVTNVYYVSQDAETGDTGASSTLPPPAGSSSSGEPVEVESTSDDSTGANTADTSTTEIVGEESTSTSSTGGDETTSTSTGSTSVDNSTSIDSLSSTGDASTGAEEPPPPPLLGLTEVCTDDSQCASGLCGAQTFEGGLGRCTVACDLDADPVNNCAAQGHPGWCLVHYGQFIHCDGNIWELPLADAGDDHHIEPGVAFSAALPFVDKDLHLLRPGADKYTVTVSAPKKVIVQVFLQDGTLIDTLSNPLPNMPNIVLKIDASAEPRWLLVSDDSNGTAYQLAATLGW